MLMPCVYRHIRSHRAFLFMSESMAEMMLFHAKSTYFIIKPNLSKGGRIYVILAKAPVNTGISGSFTLFVPQFLCAFVR